MIIESNESVFKFNNGEIAKVSDSHLGEYIRIQIGRRPENIKDLKYIEKTKELNTKFLNSDPYEEINQVYADNRLINVIDTFVTAKREKTIIYPNIDKYFNPKAIRCESITKVEILLNNNGYKARFFESFTGKICFYDLDILDAIWDKIINCEQEGVSKISSMDEEEDNDIYYGIQMYHDNGDYYEKEIYNIDELKNMIVGVRVVEFHKDEEEMSSKK